MRYRSATSDRPEVVAWVEAAVASWRSRATSEPVPVPSLLLYGPTGTGKTFAGFGALRRVAEAGLPRFGAEFASWPELLAQLRPGSGEEREQGLRRLMDAPWLLLDDLGRAKDSAWTEEILYRLVNHRYNVMLPTIITTNVPLKQFTAVFGDAPGGRLIEMTAGGRVAVTGEDRRLVR
nr:ATP-binding protein [Nocardiopsis mwathae]